MIKVALLTTWGPGCGTSEHARHILESVQDPEIQITVLQKHIGGFANEVSLKKPEFDIVHVNESGWVMQGSEHFKYIKSRFRTILTMCNPDPNNNRNPWTSSFDKVVHFEPRADDGFEFVPIGAPVYTPSLPFDRFQRRYIGTNGFPQERKNLINLAKACEEVGCNLYSFQPASNHVDTFKVASEIKRVNPGACIVTRWVSDKEMLDGLSECFMTAYPYLEWMSGSSSACMAGVSVRRPIVVSRSTQFKFLDGHEDEVYFIEHPRPTVEDIKYTLSEVLNSQSVKLPIKIYQNHNWNRVGQRYAEIYKSMMEVQ